MNVRYDKNQFKDAWIHTVAEQHIFIKNSSQPNPQGVPRDPTVEPRGFLRRLGTPLNPSLTGGKRRLEISLIEGIEVEG